MKYTVIIAMAGLLMSCGGGAGKTAASDSANATAAIINAGGTSVDSAENITGNHLIASNDCLTCHKVDEQSVGPSYRAIAAKYELNQGNIENLANKIIKGGKGLWGNAEMTPHPGLPHAQANEMARYILSLREPSDTIK